MDFLARYNGFRIYVVKTTYIEHLGQNPKLDSDDFFKIGSYKAWTGKEYKKYVPTKDVIIKGRFD